MSAPPVLVSRQGPVVHVTLNRPERRNAIGGGMGEALDEVIASLATDRDARAVVLRGAGGHFCAGLDLSEVGQGSPEERLAGGQARNRAIGERFRKLSALPQVVIAAVEGAAHAGGLGFVCAADLAFGTADARFAAPEVRRGLVPAQILPWLVRRMGRSQATRLVLEGRVVDAPAAFRMGLLHEVVADRAALDALLAEVLAALREGAPGALAETKGLLAALGPISPEGYAEAGVAAFARTAAGPEAEEGIAAFREKRRPAWAG
ncbi:enoyl-CoA hydratase/isomerase family protein [Roseococcus suduntuyensis]|uniref:Isohexenylglutaconyl-CoA hydratase n=1 Tax=Roseococcus suduntuyensis TaxID=455361 RepID=A0A840AC85_9PROT|nr:enoyl-CoA hydratase-related protein [Roseococcus suduntuyensis]MBB3897745.1 isohexenylglutaconyl-CoA hydratase [Roseococcus suduntuyensis]